MHLHIFGRSQDSVKQPFPEAVSLPDRSSGLYDDFEALTDEEMRLIGVEVERLLMLPEYSDDEWGIEYD